jgi:hypothetical protein
MLRGLLTQILTYKKTVTGFRYPEHVVDSDDIKLKIGYPSTPSTNFLKRDF